MSTYDFLHNPQHTPATTADPLLSHDKRATIAQDHPRTKPANQQTNEEAQKPGSGSASQHTDAEAQKQTSSQAHQKSTHPIKKFASYLRPDSLKQIKLLAVEQGRHDYDILQEAVDCYLAKVGRTT